MSRKEGDNIIPDDTDVKSENESLTKWDADVLRKLASKSKTRFDPDLLIELANRRKQNLDVDPLEALADMSNPKPSSEPDPNLKATDVAEWMQQRVESKGVLYQKNAAIYIRKYFGRKFVKINRNRNLAISQVVLKEFLARTRDTIVWSKQKRYWRRRRPSDPSDSREVKL